ncbi:MAG TPA: HDOD domain-containing protein [Noviherbaspirillum sp.]|uniref:HDOD domain-containing protein n=1 Tax=Noviherbaspirillum sp. TaxID=1926288 RepID=UPI002D6684EE|nr:HDOD domain-containing protein [Noviherbaspirillum sp.]HYD97136.1 HDOD domain-containing protein [Noviherbaspirillum sp.]
MPDSASRPNELAIDDVAKSIQIPACPVLLANLQQELMHEDPDPRKVASIISRDVAMSATLLRTANSAFYGLKRKAETVEQAIAFIGMTQCASIMMGLIARKTLNTTGPVLTRFWDVSDKRAMAMSLLARKLRVATPDIAHTFGLFCDIGIPLLLNRFPDYTETLKLANDAIDERFTTVEDRRHRTCHATIGALLAKNWGLSADVAMAIRLHHEYEVITDNITPDLIKSLVALSLVVEKIIQDYQHQNRHAEWEKGGAFAMDALGINVDELEDLTEELHRRFDEAG